MWFWYINDWEKNTIKNLAKYFNGKSITFFDVWFNVWDYTNTICEIFWNKVNVYWFEPVKKTYNEWFSNTKEHCNVKLYNIWLWDEEKEMLIYFGQDFDWCASISSKGEYSESISINTVDKFCKKEHINHIDFMKIDVEWYELNVLKWAKEMLLNNKIDIIQFEFFKTNVFSKVFFWDFWEMLCNDYKIYRILNNSLYEIKEYSHIDCEIFIVTNYLAVRKDINFNF